MCSAVKFGPVAVMISLYGKPIFIFTTHSFRSSNIDSLTATATTTSTAEWPTQRPRNTSLADERENKVEAVDDHKFVFTTTVSLKLLPRQPP